MSQPISGFVNEYNFLSNAYESPVTFDGVSYPTVEHAYQAAKTADPQIRETIRHLLDAETARSYGTRLAEHPIFKSNRVEIMRQILQDKFFNNIDLAKRLIDTGDRPLHNVVANHGQGRAEKFWGMIRATSPGFGTPRASIKPQGNNMLGVLLMEIRSQMIAATNRAKDARLRKVKFSGGVHGTPQ